MNSKPIRTEHRHTLNRVTLIHDSSKLNNLREPFVEILALLGVESDLFVFLFLFLWEVVSFLVEGREKRGRRERRRERDEFFFLC